MTTAAPNVPPPDSLPALAEGVFCPDCGYDLRGSTSPRCPECGHDLALLRTSQSQIPWTHRRRIGRVRAYWRTAWLVTFRTRRFCLEAGCHAQVSAQPGAGMPPFYADAQKFRWTTVILAYFAILLAKLAYRLGVHDAYEFMRTVEWLAIPIEVGTFLTLAAWTGLPSYFFHPRKLPLALQNRAVALSYYACAPLILLPLSVLPIAIPAAQVALEIAAHPAQTRHEGFAAVIGIVFGVLAILLWWLNLVGICRKTLRAPLRTAFVAIVLPLLWLLSGALIQVGLPLLTFYVATIFYTLR